MKGGVYIHKYSKYWGKSRFDKYVSNTTPNERDVFLFSRPEIVENPILNLMRDNFNSLNEAAETILNACMRRKGECYNYYEQFFPNTVRQFELFILSYTGFKFTLREDNRTLLMEHMKDFLELLTFSVLEFWDLNNFFEECVDFFDKYNEV